MRKSSLVLACAAMLCIRAAYVYGQAGDAPSSGIIVDYKVSGLKRTRPSVLRKYLDKFKGQDAALVDLNAVHAAVVETGILEPEKIELHDAEDGGGKILYIEAAEKWTILPFPVFMADTGGDISAGAFVMDMNAFGLNDKFSVGGLYRTGGFMAMLFYFHNAQRAGWPGWSAGVFYNFGEDKTSDQRNVILHRWNAHFFRPSTSLMFDFFDDKLTLSFNLGFDMVLLNTGETDFFPPEQSGARVVLSPGIRCQSSHFDGFLMFTRSLALSYTAMPGIQGGGVQTIDLKGVFEQPVIPGLKVNFSAAAAYAFDADLFSFFYPNSIAPLLPASYAADVFAGARLGLEKYLFKWKYGVLSVIADYQAVESKNPDLGWSFDHGPGGALSLYLSRVALPALAVTVNYNAAKNYFSSSFLLGMSF